MPFTSSRPFLVIGGIAIGATLLPLVAHYTPWYVVPALCAGIAALVAGGRFF